MSRRSSPSALTASSQIRAAHPCFMDWDGATEGRSESRGSALPESLLIPGNGRHFLPRTARSLNKPSFRVQRRPRAAPRRLPMPQARSGPGSHQCLPTGVGRPAPCKPGRSLATLNVVADTSSLQSTLEKGAFLPPSTLLKNNPHSLKYSFVIHHLQAVTPRTSPSPEALSCQVPRAPQAPMGAGVERGSRFPVAPPPGKGSLPADGNCSEAPSSSSGITSCFL